MARNLDESVVVVTGASSGIGRATARRFAKAGATVVVAARREGPLRELARELGPAALAVPVDVTDEEAVQGLARAAMQRFGGIDVWVNNAAVTAFGRFEEVPHDAYRRVIETDLLGYVHGAWAALPELRRRGGALINVASVNSCVGAPYVSAYVASKSEWSVAAVGRGGRQMILMHALAPTLLERLFARRVERNHFEPHPSPPHPGNVFAPVDEGTDVSGGWRPRSRAGRKARWPGRFARGRRARTRLPA